MSVTDVFPSTPPCSIRLITVGLDRSPDCSQRRNSSPTRHSRVPTLSKLCVALVRRLGKLGGVWCRSPVAREDVARRLCLRTCATQGRLPRAWGRTPFRPKVKFRQSVGALASSRRVSVRKWHKFNGHRQAHLLHLDFNRPCVALLRT